MPRPRKAAKDRLVPLAVYVPRKLLDRLRKAAVRDRRSISSEALVFIEFGLEKRRQ